MQCPCCLSWPVISTRLSGASMSQQPALSTTTTPHILLCLLLTLVLSLSRPRIKQTNKQLVYDYHTQPHYTTTTMSSSIQIPRRRRKVTDLERDQAASGSSSNSSSPAFSPSTPTSSRFGTSYDSSSGSLPKGEGEVRGLPAAARPARRLSLLSRFVSFAVSCFTRASLCLVPRVARGITSLRWVLGGIELG